MKIILWIFIKLILLKFGQIIATDDNIKQREIIFGSLVDPCNDFHQYACGSWNRVFTGAVTQYNDTIEMLDYNVNKQMSNIFNKFSLEGKPIFIQEAYKYYKSCANLKGDELNKNLMLTIKNENMQSVWFKTLAKMRKYDFNDIFISQEYFVWVDDNRKVFIYFDKPDFETIDFDNFKIVVIYLGTINDDEAMNKLWLEIQDFEKKLQNLDNITDIELEYEDDRLNAIEDLPFDWLKEYVKIILNQTKLEPKMKIYIKNIPYMKALEELLKKYNQHFLNQYLEIRFLNYLVFQEFFELNEIKCLSNTRLLMPFAMHWLYEKQHPELLKEYNNIYQIFDNLRNSFNKTIIENKYKFNATDVKFLLNKVNNMQLRFNNLPRTNTIATLEELYKDLNLDVHNFYENHLKLQNYIFQIKMNLTYNNKVILDDTYYIPDEHSSLPYYEIYANILVLPLTLLQQPIYSPDLDDIYKYSTLGFLMTKDFITGFDHNGLFSGSNGVMCSKDFTEYPLFNDSINFLREINPETIIENIGYASGVRYAYQTYFSLNPDAGNETQIIHDEEISLNKVFFLNLAQAFCETIAKPSDAEYIIYALKYFPKFSETFKCTTKHLLYSTEVRHVW